MHVRIRKFYLAGPIADKEMLTTTCNLLENTTLLQCTAKWFEMGPVDQNSIEALQERAYFDIQGLKNCDVGIVKLPAGFGTHVELGWLLSANRPTFLWYPDGEEAMASMPYKCVFHYHTHFMRVVGNQANLLSQVISWTVSQ